MRQAIATLALGITSVLTIAGCDGAEVNAQTASTETMIPRPLVERELTGLLLTTDQVNAAMGATAMTVIHQQAAMSDNSTTMAPPECLAIDGAAEATVYADSGSWAERDQSLNDGDKFAHYLKQAVVLFPTPEKAAAFFDTSAQQWSACQQYTHLQSGTIWSAAPPVNANGVLSTTSTEHDAAAPGWGCGRALALRNNVIADVNTCSASPGDSAPKIASQIAANVSARW
ncbi:sensor domain-containing protein [Mycolicibacterium madagascariense]|uniref:Sensor domain-containing protein n=1 Tax=Mycolicibacterium madagascariense TaxID=212765 RepID=A0A7I7X7T0_9MYCO|nr:sensor domain-containing protein [Mycolicibacterium madagascariense]MCV7013372.1 sensor domain-containing protein [Mycolicibacterium madagascariense]BBZ25909.1 sensor domain-containing protein [Mycolicibacterium madagascariense]